MLLDQCMMAVVIIIIIIIIIIRFVKRQNVKRLPWRVVIVVAVAAAVAVAVIVVVVVTTSSPAVLCEAGLKFTDIVFKICPRMCHIKDHLKRKVMPYKMVLQRILR